MRNPIAAPAKNTLKTGALTPATIKNEDTGETLTCQFNPSEYTVSKTVQWKPRGNGGRDVPVTDFGGGDGRTMQMELFFDAYEKYQGGSTKGQGVKAQVDALWNLTQISPKIKHDKTGQGRPPMLTFQWGTAWSFKAGISQLAVRYVLFARDGTPVRAIANVTFQEMEDEKAQKGTNPTSESLPGYRRREVRPLDTLSLIAYEEYGDPTVWRLIAEENGIIDPLDLPSGLVLGIPPR